MYSRIHQNTVYIRSAYTKYDILHAELKKNLTLLGFHSVKRETTADLEDQIKLEFEDGGLRHLECSVKIPSQDISIARCQPEKEAEEIASFKGVCSQRHM